MSLKIWSDSTYRCQFGSHVDCHNVTVVCREYPGCLGWFGEFQLLFWHLLSWAPHWFQPLCDKKYNNQSFALQTFSTVTASAAQRAACRFSSPSSLKSSMYSGSHLNAHNVASCGQSHQRKRRAMNIHYNRGTSSICTKSRPRYVFMPFFFFFPLCCSLLRVKAAVKKVHYEHIFITWTLQSQRFLPSEISACALRSRRREYLLRWKTNFANTPVL